MPKYPRKWDVFQRIEYVKQILKDIEDIKDSTTIKGCTLHIWHYKLNRRDSLSNLERLVYEVLLKHDLHAKTVYEWFLLEDLPPHIKEKLISGKISMKDASKMNNSWKRMISTRAGKEIINEIRLTIGGLKWKGQEDLVKL